jgi:pullulanase/glycogen debranching enzyme
LGQGVPFFQAGVDMLRSKSLDRNSYNSGDWFNVLDFTYQTNNFGVGLPPAEDGQADNWPLMSPLLVNPALYPTQADIEFSVELFKEWLEIRYSSPLFRLQTAGQIDDRVAFYNTGPNALPGVIVMHLSDQVAGLAEMDNQYDEIVVIINANDEAQSIVVPEVAGQFFVLHDVQRHSVDPVVQGAVYQPGGSTFVVPARTTAVFVVKDRFRWYR